MQIEEKREERKYQKGEGFKGNKADRRAWRVDRFKEDCLYVHCV